MNILFIEVKLGWRRTKEGRTPFERERERERERDKL